LPSRTIRLAVEPTTCMGIAMCESLCPDRFEVRDGYSHVVGDDRFTADEAEELVDGCPSGAMHVVRSDDDRES
jgi:ferredoxin